MSGQKRRTPPEAQEPGIRKYFCREASDSESQLATSSQPEIDHEISSLQSEAESVRSDSQQQTDSPQVYRRNNDIGSIGNLTSGEKYTLLTEPYKPDHAYKFPTVYNSGCNRSFQYKWLCSNAPQTT